MDPSSPRRGRLQATSDHIGESEMGLKSEISGAERGVENGDSGWESSLPVGRRAGRRAGGACAVSSAALHQLELLLLKSDRGFVPCAVADRYWD